jgi:hypothetical protein
VRAPLEPAGDTPAHHAAHRHRAEQHQHRQAGNHQKKSAFEMRNPSVSVSNTEE